MPTLPRNEFLGYCRIVPPGLTAASRTQPTSIPAEDLPGRLKIRLAYYAYRKPHQGLHDATPAELYKGNNPACLEATHPPRAYEAKTDDQLFRISYADLERILPVLTIDKAA